MENNSDLNRMVNGLIKNIFSDALGVSLKDPAMAAFFVRAAMAQKKAASVRQKNEEHGLHVPPVMILASPINVICTVQVATRSLSPANKNLRWTRPV